MRHQSQSGVITLDLLIHIFLKVLLVIEQCNPEWSSVPQIGYQMFSHLCTRADVHLVTHVRNKNALTAKGHTSNITYIEEPAWLTKYFSIVSKLTQQGAQSFIWPLFHFLAYPVYASFNRDVYAKFADKVRSGEYDVVHAFSPVIPRYPVKIAKACHETPFILGPVNGGLPFPSAFRSVARKEHAYLSFLRLFTRLIPGYKKTYHQASKVLVGSSYTLSLVHKLFGKEKVETELYYENGLSDHFFYEKKDFNKTSSFRLLFVGRLVPYKRADIVIKAISKLPENIRKNIFLTIIGDGPERSRIDQAIKDLGLSPQVTVTKWLTYEALLPYYHSSDVFCFPSIREFGGAVVAEAMAASLPCIVAKNGGIGEYVTPDCGFAIEPISEEYIVDQMASHIKKLYDDRELLCQMSKNAYQRAVPMRWQNKTDRLMEIYQSVVDNAKKH